MLPAGDLRENEQAELIAAVDEGRVLRIMRGSHGVAAELVFEDIRVEALHARRHSVTDVWIALVAVEAAELDFFAVEVKAVRTESDIAEADAGIVFVDDLSAAQELRAEGIELRLPKAPPDDLSRRKIKLFAAPDLLFGDRVPAVEHAAAERHARAVPGEGDIRRDPSGRLGLHENVLDKALLPDIEPNLAVEPAVGHVIDHEAEGRLIERFPCVEADRDAVLPADLERAGELRFKGGVARAMLRKLLPVQEDFGKMRRCADAEEDALPRPFFGNFERLRVAADHLIDTFVEIIVGRLSAGMRKVDALTA